jgi:hypothetical protein
MAGGHPPVADAGEPMTALVAGGRFERGVWCTVMSMSGHPTFQGRSVY